MKVFITSRVKYVAALVFWLMVWQAASGAVANEVMLVSPASAFSRLFELSMAAAFWRTIGFSLSRIIAGFSLAMIMGVILAAFSAWSNLTHVILAPVFDIIKSVPVALFVILALFWLHSSHLSLFISFITVLPIVYFKVFEGIKNAEPRLLEMAYIFKISPLRKIRHIYFIAVVPHIIASANAGLSFAFKAGISAEIIGIVRDTIGFNLHTASNLLQTRDIFAWTIAIIILGSIMERIFLAFLGRMSRWQ